MRREWESSCQVIILLSQLERGSLGLDPTTLDIYVERALRQSEPPLIILQCLGNGIPRCAALKGHLRE